MEEGVLGKVKSKRDRAQRPCSLLPLEGIRVIIFPPENKTEPRILHLSKETHMQRDGLWGNRTSMRVRLDATSRRACAAVQVLL